MPTWKPNYDPAHLYFITITAVNRAMLFKRTLVRRLLVDVLDTMRLLHKLDLYAFVIMPNHMHFIVRCTPDYTVGDLMRDYKSNAANRIVWQHQAEGNDRVLKFLREAVLRPEKQRYKVWDDEYNAKDVFTPEFLCEKLDYTHNNPVQPHWQLVERPEDYIWSSARFYFLGEPALIPLRDAREGPVP